MVVYDVISIQNFQWRIVMFNNNVIIFSIKGGSVFVDLQIFGQFYK